MISTTPQASIVITSRNRKEELRNAIASALRQTAAIEVLVIDDASTDGTAAMVREEFPQVRLEESPSPGGYIVQRNRGAELAAAPIIISIDDDAAFPSPRTVEQTLALFDDPRIGAVAMPFIDVRLGDRVQSVAPDSNAIYVVGSYIGTAHAIRRDLFLRVGGYRTSLFHFNEERDFCARLFNAGYVVRLGTSDPIHHFVSPKRQQSRGYIWQGRNSVLFPWHNTPMPHLLPHLAATTFNVLKAGILQRHPIWAVWGLTRGWGACVVERRNRRPVTRRTHSILRRLKSGVPVALARLEPELEPMRFDAAPNNIKPADVTTTAGSKVAGINVTS